jgi:hypothetical protein
MSAVRMVGLAVAALGLAAMDTGEEAPRLLLIVREQLRPESRDAYGKNELQIAAACARLKCPHPYLALAPVAGAPEVWWLNAFASQEEKDQVEAVYSRNEGLMAELRPLGKHKEAFRHGLTTTLTRHRPDLRGNTPWRIKGARFVVIGTVQTEGAPLGAVFESSDGRRFVVESAASRSEADRIAARAGASSVLLAVQPQWSFPDLRWIAADPEFWKSNPLAHRR